jgi:hypothetical protein
MKKTAMFFVALVLFVVASKAHALTFTATKASNNPGQTNSASATFTIVDMDLVVTLSNLSDFKPNDAPDILTGIFFQIAGGAKLTPVSAEVATDSSVIDDRSLPSGFNGNVGGEWAYRSNLTKTPGAADEGISSTSLKWFGGKKYLFPGENLGGGKSPGGIDFGLTSLTDTSHIKGSLKNVGLIQDTVVFTFAGLPPEFSLSDISDVTFQYGKSLKSAEEITGEQLAVIPEPNTILLVAAGLAGVVALGRRRSVRR